MSIQRLESKKKAQFTKQLRAKIILEQGEISIHSVPSRGHICKNFPGEHASGPQRFMNLWHLSAQPLLIQQSAAINE